MPQAPKLGQERVGLCNAAEITLLPRHSDGLTEDISTPGVEAFHLVTINFATGEFLHLCR